LTKKENWSRSGIKHANLEKTRILQGEQTRIWHGINSGRVTRGTDQLVGYGKQLKMIFSPSTGAYKQVGVVLKPYLIFFKLMGTGTFLDHHALLSVIHSLKELLPIPALDGGHVMFLLYE
jgi:regulator of sigma E protease